MPVFSKRAYPPAMPCPGNSQDDYRRADLVNIMMSQAARSLPPSEWPAAARQALAVADELYPEEVANG